MEALQNIVIQVLSSDLEKGKQLGAGAQVSNGLVIVWPYK